MPSRPTQRWTFGILLLLAGILFCWTISGLWVSLVLGMLLGAVTAPVMPAVERRLGARPRLAAALVTLVSVVTGSALAVLLGAVVLGEVLRFMRGPAEGYGFAALDWLRSGHAGHLLGRLGWTEARAVEAVRQSSAAVAGRLTELAAGLLALTSHGLLTLVFTTLTTYYLLVERRTLGRFALRMVPLPERQTRALMREFREASVGILLGIVAVGLAQGVLAGLAYFAAGVPRPLVWAALTAVASAVPGIGTALVTLPIAAALALGGHLAAAIGLFLAWAVVVVGGCDYVLRPLLMNGHMRLHPLLVLLAVFGGLEAFGPLGIVLGPVAVAMFVALIRLYERDYRAQSVGARLAIHEGETHMRDPYCGVEIEEADDAFEETIDTEVVYFCSARCRERFLAERSAARRRLEATPLAQ